VLTVSSVEDIMMHDIDCKISKKSKKSKTQKYFEKYFSKHNSEKWFPYESMEAI